MGQSYNLPFVAMWALSLFALPAIARAEVIELVNGDVVRGKVLSLNENTLELQSESFGTLQISRNKLAAIYFGSPPSRTTAATEGMAETIVAAPRTSAALAAQQQVAGVPSVDDVMNQLRGGGIDSASLKAVEQKIPLLSTPEAGGYFNEQVAGLITGQLDIEDIRKDAIYAADQLKDLQEELGPSGDALNGWLSILERFIADTAPAASAPSPPATEHAEEHEHNAAGDAQTGTQP